MYRENNNDQVCILVIEDLVDLICASSNVYIILEINDEHLCGTAKLIESIIKGSFLDFDGFL